VSQQPTVCCRCPPGASFRLACDLGARALDARDGALDSLVRVCGVFLTPPPGQQSIPILLACNISTLVPGSYNLSYSVTNSAGRVASTWRTLTVTSMCPTGERLCADRVR
jgi:hypothetical protein